jgi:uncharacterized membrane protein
MSRVAFMGALRSGLQGLPGAAIDDIVADYENHFADGMADGRSEAEIAAALGDPNRLARELRAEVGLKKWEEKRSPGNAATAVFAVLGLGALDIIILLPILMSVIGVLIGLFFGAVGIFIGGSVVLTVGPFVTPIGGPLAAVLFGVGLIASAVAQGAILTMVTIGMVNLLVWYARLHYQLLKPAIDA